MRIYTENKKIVISRTTEIKLLKQYLECFNIKKIIGKEYKNWDYSKLIDMGISTVEAHIKQKQTILYIMEYLADYNEIKIDWETKNNYKILKGISYKGE